MPSRAAGLAPGPGLGPLQTSALSGTLAGSPGGWPALRCGPLPGGATPHRHANGVHACAGVRACLCLSCWAEKIGRSAGRSMPHRPGRGPAVCQRVGWPAHPAPPASSHPSPCGHYPCPPRRPACAGGRRAVHAAAHLGPRLPGARGPLVGRPLPPHAPLPGAARRARPDGAGKAPGSCVAGRAAPCGGTTGGRPGGARAGRVGRPTRCRRQALACHAERCAHRAAAAPCLHCWPRPCQVENEYGFCGEDKEYLRHLIATARRHLSGQPRPGRDAFAGQRSVKWE